MAEGATVLFVDSFDTSGIDLIVDSTLTVWRDGASFREKFQHLPNVIAALRTGNASQSDVRIIGIDGHVLSANVATLLSNTRELKYRLRQGELTIQFADDTTRHYNAYLHGPIRITGIHPSMIQVAHQISFDLLCLDPRHYEDAQQSIAFTGATAMPMGTAPVEPVIQSTTGTFTVTYKDFSGATIATFSMAGAAGPFPIIIDMFNKTVKANDGTTRIADATTFEFFSLDPNDGDFTASQWPTLEISVGTGTSIYNKADL